MLKKIPIRLRLTLLSVLLLTACCVGLTAILNLSANRMANVIEATAVTPAQIIRPEEAPPDKSSAIGMAPVIPTGTSQAARDQFLQQSIFFMLLIVALGGALTYFISGEALLPLQELSRQMKNRTVHNLSEDLPIPASRDEIADLTRSFNEMSGKLDDAFAMQKRFSQSAAHELRTPLTVLKTKVEVFHKKQEHTPQEYDKLLSVVATHTNRLADLVTDLLSLTNMDALDCDEPVELKAILSDALDELSALASEKNVTLTIDGDAPDIRGNRSLLRRAFYNLIENAIKYNTVGGRVALQLSIAERRAVITISDTGIGIPPDARELIFEPFYRVDKSRSRRMGGAGLGLSMVKSIVDKHGGTLAVADNPCGGTIFQIAL